MATAYLIRHGETNFSQMGITQGQTDVPLNETGIHSITQLGAYISTHIQVDRIFVSDLLRCQQTCELILKQLSYKVICTTTRSLREISLGVFEGQTMDRLNSYRYDSGDYNSFVPHGGESINELIVRIRSWFISNYDSFSNALIISHRGPMSVIAEGAGNCDEFEIDDVLRQGNIIKMELLPEKKYRIDKVIEVVKHD